MMGLDPETTSWLSKLLVIIFLDLILAGDNAVVIAMAAKRLPPEIQRKAVLWGTFFAILVRVLMTLVVFALINLPGLMAIGGLLLFWIAYRMMVEEEGSGEEGKTAENFFQAIRIIVIADTVMGLDNIIAIAGAAEGDVTLIIIGLAVSIPIMIWGSLMLLRLLRRYPWIIYLGGMVLAYVAAKMLMNDPFVKEVLGAPHEVIRDPVILTLTVGCTALGWFVSRRRAQARAGGAGTPT